MNQVLFLITTEANKKKAKKIAELLIKKKTCSMCILKKYMLNL